MSKKGVAFVRCIVYDVIVAIKVLAFIVRMAIRSFSAGNMVKVH